MTLLSQILDVADLEREIAAGYVNRRFHPEFPELAIVGYSDRAQIEGHWTPTVRAARGIIYRTDSLEVLARPFAKFFNHGQEAGVSYDLDAPLLGAFDKKDGSLGIRYTRPDGKTAIATRGSFDSEQARHATALAWSLGWGPSSEYVTPLYEIVYPENRIVLDYGDLDELLPLGSVHVHTGRYFPPAECDLERAPASTLRELLALPPRANAEGYVAWLNPWTAVKLKQADYLALHRIVSNLTTKEVWRQLRDGTFDAFVEALPDEFHAWAKAEAEPLVTEYEAVTARVEGLWKELVRLGLNYSTGRKEAAAWLRENAPDVMGYVFSRLDWKDYSAGVWRSLEPKLA